MDFSSAQVSYYGEIYTYTLRCVLPQLRGPLIPNMKASNIIFIVSIYLIIIAISFSLVSKRYSLIYDKVRGTVSRTVPPHFSPVFDKRFRYTRLKGYSNRGDIKSALAMSDVDGDPEGRLSITSPLVKTKNEVSLREVFTSRSLNVPGILWLTVGDALLYVSAGFFGFLCDVDASMPATSFLDVKVLSDSSFIAAGLCLAGFLLDRVPTRIAKEIKSDTRFFTLRLLGRNTNWLNAFSAATLVSGLAAVAEETFSVASS